MLAQVNGHQPSQQLAPCSRSSIEALEPGLGFPHFIDSRSSLSELVEANHLENS